MVRSECRGLVEKIKDFTVVVDYDNTLTTSHDNIAVCAPDVVQNAQRLAVNTFNADVTYGACCTDPKLLAMGFCPNGKCRVRPEHWAHRRNNDIVLKGKKVGTWDEYGVKTRVMERMKLSPSKTMFLDDLESNVGPAHEAGYNVGKVDGRSGVNGRVRFMSP